MSKLSQVLDETRAKIAKYRRKNLSEENTKAALINPVLRALGWDVENPEEVVLEYRYTQKDNPVDYALLVSTAKLFVEAKALGHNLDDHKWATQIVNYGNAAGVKWVVLTDGNEYRIYNACVPVPLEEKLFRTVRLSDPSSHAKETLLLLSKELFNDLEEQWKRFFADSQIHAAINKLFSPAPESVSVLVSFVKKHVKELPPKEIKSSLARLRASFEFPVDPPPPPPPPSPYREFWEPIQTEPNGLFAGKPSNGSWITKTLRGITISLVVHNHACCVDLGFYKEDRLERRSKALKLFPATEYPREPRETDKCAIVRFPVLSKGIKDGGDWSKIRAKLTKLGADIYNKINESDV